MGFTSRSSVAVLIPVLARPHRVAALLESLAAATRSPYRALFICDPHDHAEQQAVRDAGAEALIVAGNYARKINQGVAASTDPLIFLGADDLHFHPGWLAHARQHLAPGIGVVGTNDLGNPRVVSGRHATHCLVTRAYASLGCIDQPGQLLCEAYAHNFVDDELVATARRREAWAFARQAVVEHQHPHWGKADMDATYETGLASFEADRELHRTRIPLWT
jgi:glycosyltransferase involved in cell wall biosynthesis